MHQTLHPAVTGKKTNARGKKWRVVRVALRIQQVYPGEIALAPGRRVQPSLRSDPERPGANPPLGHETQQQIEPDAVRADDHQVRRHDCPTQQPDPTAMHTFNISPKCL